VSECGHENFWKKGGESAGGIKKRGRGEFSERFPTGYIPSKSPDELPEDECWPTFPVEGNPRKKEEGVELGERKDPHLLRWGAWVLVAK